MKFEKAFVEIVYINADDVMTVTSSCKTYCPTDNLGEWD